MALAYFQDDIRNGLIADVVLVIHTASERSALNTQYLRGVISLALAQAMSYGISRRRFADQLREELPRDDVKLLEAIL